MSTQRSASDDADDAPGRPPWAPRPWEWLAWSVIFCVAATGNALTTRMEALRSGENLPLWAPMTWEWSSALASLVLMPALLWLCRRWPLHADGWLRRVPLYVAASLAWSLLHVLGMVALRKLVYRATGGHYDFGDWPRELVYEYLKDVRTFALIVWLDHTYHWFRRRRQGEARLLDAPDDAPPIEPVERPRRFLVRKLGREFLVPVDEIEWMQASGNYVNLRVRNRDYPLRTTISGIAERLDPARFARIHRSYIVNLDHVASIEPLDTGDARVHLRDGNVVPCSRRHRDVLRGVAGAWN